MHPEAQTLEVDFNECLTILGSDRGALPWTQRRGLVKSAARHLECNGPSEPVATLLFLLADDPKWEVRSDVADCLPLVSDDEFPRLAAKLSQDDNAFVRQAAQRSLQRRRRGQESLLRKRRGLDHVQDQYDGIEQTHGTVAAQKAREMAEQLYDILVGATVHDMRNFLAPLKSAISSLLGNLEDGQIDVRPLRGNLVKMGHQAEMIERMLEDMRTYSQPTPHLRKRERLADMIQDAHNAVLDIFRATGRDASAVTIGIDVPLDLTMDAARFDMVRALMNLIKNAYESHARGPDSFTAGHVRVKVLQCDCRRLEITFSDDGMGLSQEELQEVRRFIPGGTSKKTYGTGFGLPTAKRKIEAHGGSLAIESSEDAGTTVTVVLPIEAPQEQI